MSIYKNVFVYLLSSLSGACLKSVHSHLPPQIWNGVCTVGSVIFRSLHVAVVFSELSLVIHVSKICFCIWVMLIAESQIN